MRSFPSTNCHHELPLGLQKMLHGKANRSSYPPPPLSKMWPNVLRTGVSPPPLVQ